MHSTIKLHLDPEEFAPIDRLAKKLRVTPEAIAYAGLNCIMQRARDADIQREITVAHSGRREGLPMWADDARGVHIYESKQDE
ncbi:MAG TPA: hypothetical protein VLW52_08130 [Opitutaceae bacterium]|nr:hypothetical protein [Opitutaceae bacterium]